LKIRDIIPVALGKTEADVILKNAKIVNVFTGKIEQTSIALFRKRIAGIGDYTAGKKIIDLKGKYVVPGLIDAHLHIESSMLSPDQFAKAVVSRGTTTVVADPHEITNVCGIDGLKYIIESTEGIPLNVYIAVPSAVPVSDFETSGAKIDSEDMASIVEKFANRIIALGEVMNVPGVLNCEKDLITKIEILRHRYKKIEGHAPGVKGKELNAYIDAFIRSDHESLEPDEALEKVSKGMQVFIREGSAAKDLEKLIKAVDVMNHHFFSFCTDDRDPVDIMTQGHIDYLVRRSIELGLNPIIAIRMATINTARYFNLRSMGAIAPGYKADMVVINDLRNFDIEMVIKDSKIVFKDGEIVGDFSISRDKVWTMGKINTMELSKENLKIRGTGKKIRVIGLKKGSLITEEILETPKILNGEICSDPNRDIIKVVIFDRYNAKNFSIGFVKGTGIKKGAFATSIGHDSHNLCSLGVNDEDILHAVQEVKNMNGGIAVVSNRKTLSKLQLPLGGLMSNRDLLYVVKKLSEVKESLKEIGCDPDMLMTIEFIQLPVIPKIKITDRGIVDVENQRFVDLFV